MKKKLIVISGWASQPILFKNLFKLLSGEYEITLLEFNDIDSIQDIYERGKNIIDRQGNITVLGWSMGAMMLLRLMAEYDNIKRAIIIGGFPKFAYNSTYKYGFKERYIKNMIIELDSKSHKVLDKFFSNVLNDKEMDNLQLRYDMDKESLKLGLEYLIMTDMREYLDRIRCKDVTIIHGKNDMISSYDNAVYLNENISNSKLVLIEGCGHAPFYESYDEVYNIISKED